MFSHTQTIKSVRPLYPSDKPTQFVTSEGKRSDNRTLDEFRNICI
jgi:exosome complex RNA-binding protein Rrp42 (RNase PH superfamily)